MTKSNQGYDPTEKCEALALGSATALGTLALLGPLAIPAGIVAGAIYLKNKNNKTSLNPNKISKRGNDRQRQRCLDSLALDSSTMTSIESAEPQVMEYIERLKRNSPEDFRNSSGMEIQIRTGYRSNNIKVKLIGDQYGT